jgi:hypothetical protein
VNSTDFSVVVQGPIHSSPGRLGERDVTIHCLASIRTFLPGAEVILSTWKNAPSDGLDCDRLVLSDDPGAEIYSGALLPPLFNNINRQIISTRAGLAIARRPYAIKFRGDLALESAALLDHGEYLRQSLSGTLFRHRVLITPYQTRDPRHTPILFNFSDIVQIGLREDLQKIWSVPLAPEPQTSRWLAGRRSTLFAPVPPFVKMRVSPEQYLTLELLKLSGNNIVFDHPLDISISKALLSEKTLLENYRIFEPEQLGIRFSKRLLGAAPRAELYSARQWERLSTAYEKKPARWVAQINLVTSMSWNALWFLLRKHLEMTTVQNSSIYQWIRGYYRRLESSK